MADCIDWVISIEGGLVEDAKDEGGVTKYGISQNAYPALDIRALTRSQAVQIYQRDYWERCRCSDLPLRLRLLVFDAAVNQGQDAAVKMLQLSANVVIDGVIGPKTLAGANGVTVAEYAAQRMRRYGITFGFDVFGLGWSRRLMACITAALTA